MSPRKGGGEEEYKIVICSYFGAGRKERGGGNNYTPHYFKRTSEESYHFSFLFFRHMCMVMRGVQQTQATTTTSCMLGVFREDPKTREEFLTLTRT